MLVVAAPAAMQPSIQTAIERLSEGGRADAEVVRSVAFDLWVVEVADEVAVADDPALAAVQPLLDQARAEFGLGPLRLFDRAMVVMAKGERAVGEVFGSVTSPRMKGIMELKVMGETFVEVGLNITLNERVNGAVDVRQRNSIFQTSSISLPNDQWQVIGLLGGDAANAPNRLLLMRQRTASPAP